MVMIPDIKTLYRSEKVSAMKKKPKEERLFSSMTWGIMLFNVFALAILAGSLIYTKSYQTVLLNREAALLQDIAVTYTEVLAQITKSADGNINEKAASEMLLQFSENKGRRIVLFDAEKRIMFDSTPRGTLEKEKSGNYLLLYSENEKPLIKKIVNDAAAGIISSSWIRLSDNITHVYAAAPVIKKNKILGTVLVGTRADFMKGVANAMQLEIITIFVGTFCFTFILSVYFSRQLAKPLHQLAEAADIIREKGVGDVVIPDFGMRDDEIGDLSVALREMTESLKKRMESIEQFAADVSHELKNPLTSIRSAFETLPKITDENNKKRLRTIIEQDLWRLDRLITDISRASRLDAQLLKEMMEPFDLKSLLRDSIHVQNDLISRLIADGKIKSDKIALHFLDASSRNEVVIKGLPMRLVQVFDNIIMNAASFSPDNSAITVTLMSDDEYAMVIVDDEGPGIPEEKFDKIFERFYTDRPHDHSGLGNSSGLGLNISKQISEAHKGTVWAENRTSPEGNVEGARFIILLPVMRPPKNEKSE